MQNKANFIRFSPENADFTKKQTQNKPNLSQNKPNSNPISKICPRQKPYEKTTKFENKKVDSKPVGC
jgi:hypothetical protein